MDFKATVKSEIEEKYYQMLNASTPTPYDREPEVDNLQIYANKRNKYHKRLNDEMGEFNNACQTVKDRKNSRISAENRAKEERSNRRFRKGQAIRTCIFFFPLLIALFVGLDVFNASHGHIDKINAMEGLTLGWVIFFYVVFCLASVISAIILTVRMFSDESYDSYVKRKERGYKKAAIVVAFISIFIVSLNLMQILPNLSKNKITYLGGDIKTYEYIDKGDSIILPEECLKSDVAFNDYRLKYVLIGWDINGETYAPGITYTPKGREEAKALYREDKYCKITVSTVGYAKVTVKYSDGREWNGEEVLYGTSMIVTCSNAGQEQTQQINGVEFSSPYTFEITKHTSIYCSGQDNGCLVEGTQITLANGTTKAVENLEMGDILAIFNHESGKYEFAPLLCNVHANTKADYFDIINLYFSNGTVLRIVDEHGLFDKDLNKYVYINEENVQDYVGHNFISSIYQDDEILSNSIILEKAEITNEYVKIFNPASVWHINLIANDMLTLSAGMVNLFEYDENMKYDEILMAEDIKKYGLYSYDDFKGYVSFEVFNAFPFKYYKVVVEKGLYSFEQVIGLIQYYNNVDSVK